jgi:F0F1-type ATP synthase beta subunit
VRFDADLPPIYSVLHAGAKQEIIIEVLAQRDARHVRGIALTPTQGLARGMPVLDTGGPLQVPLGKACLVAHVQRLWGDHRPRTRLGSGGAAISAPGATAA